MGKKLLVKLKLQKARFGQLLGLLLISGFSVAQSVSGKVTAGENGEALPGVSIIVKGTTKGTVTDAGGTYRIAAEARDVLVFSYIGYLSQEVVVGDQTSLNIGLKPDSKSLQEVIVTGVFDKRTALQSSIAISTLNSAAISKLTTNSAADLLSYMPGVYVNSAAGEINNTVYSRGVAANQFGSAGGNGYYYVSLMEDGLPVSNISSGNVVADYFYRADATLNRLEAVRGGSASITGANAPGGIFNYVSKTGQVAANEITYKVGLEGNGKNLFNRLDGNVGGQIGTSGWYYNVGGFYRSAEGARYPGYNLNVGGQIKANVYKPLEKGGFIKLYAKYLNDKNALAQNLPATNYDNPHLVSGFTNTDTYMLPGTPTTAPLWNKTDTYVFDPKDLSHSKDFALGAEFSYPLGKGWTVNNNIKFTTKTEKQSLTIFPNPTALDDFATYILVGGFFTPGTYSFKDRTTGAEVASVAADYTQGPSYKVLTNTLPGSVMKDGVLFNYTSYSKSKVNEFMDQLSLNKKAGNHSLTVGTFLASSTIDTDPNGPAGSNARAIAPNSSPLDVSLKTSSGTLQLTNPEGYGNLSSAVFFRSFSTTQKQNSLFVADGIQVSPALTIDLGVRYDRIAVNGTNNAGKPNTDGPGGKDGNPLTVYDNGYFVKGTDITYKSSLDMFSYSAGVNYQLNGTHAIYTRFSNGQKSPDLQFYFDNYLQSDAKPVVKAQSITQFEIGYKFKTAKASGSIIPFYSNLSDIPVSALGTDDKGVGYYTPVVYNSIRTFGLEAETDVKLSNSFSVKANATVQSAKNTIWQAWNLNNNGAADDALTNNNGKTAENIPKLMFNITPMYSGKKGYLFLACKYMGERQGNTSNAFQMPAFTQFNLGAGYNISAKISLAANINNLFNTFGVMNWSPSTAGPGGFFNVFGGHDVLTPAIRQANPNAVYSVLPVQPRAYFMSIKYSF